MLDGIEICGCLTLLLVDGKAVWFMGVTSRGDAGGLRTVGSSAWDLLVVITANIWTALSSLTS